MAGGSRGNRVSRRTFIKLAAIGGAGAFAGVSGLAYPSGWQKWLAYGRKPWEVDLGVVDYDLVKKYSYGPPELGFEKDIRSSPTSARTLNVAQWYDYWPGKTISDFTTYMKDRWDIDGCDATSWTSNIYISNEELFTWVTQTGKKFDVMVPTNYTVETMEKAGLLVNLNKAWLPNYLNIFGRIPSQREKAIVADYTRLDKARPFYSVKAQPDYPDKWDNGYNNVAKVDFRDPEKVGYQYRMNKVTYPNARGTANFTWNEENSLVAMPYQWGTTGIGYRSDIFDTEDIERMGWEIFELKTYTNPKTGKTYDLSKRKMMLDDMREVFTAALKAEGWKRQVKAGLTPTAAVRVAEAPFNQEYQWSNSEVAEDKLLAARDWLLSFRDTSYGFNTPQQGPWLVSGIMYVDQAWSGDVMYAVRPNSSQHLPVDYFVPRQGGARWLDNLTIHRESERLWLAHEFINYIHDPKVQATISAWNLYATPDAWSFMLLENDPAYAFKGQNLDGSPYSFVQTHDPRIYSDIATGYNPNNDPKLHILERGEYQKDVGVRNNLRYFSFWRQVKF